MAKSPNVFGGGGADVATIEAISGQQAHVNTDFEVYEDITVLNEHGQTRQIQNLENNLKNHLGIERIPFNGIDELDTERGPNGETVYALNSGDSRIRFIDGLEQWKFSVSNNAGGTQPGPTIQLRSEDGEQSGTELMGSVEITFFGTGLNILSWTDTSPANWLASVDGGTPTQISPNNNTINLTNPAQIDVAANRNTKVNQVVPIVSGLTAGVHTVKIDGHRHGQGAGAGGSQLPLFGCEIINESSNIVVQPGADFSSNIELLPNSDGLDITLPIKPSGFTGTTGARVINYLTSSGELKQIFTGADEVLNTLAGASQYSIQWDNSSGTITVPASASTIKIIAIGPGANGSGDVGGGGGGWAEVEYTRDVGNTSTLDLTTIAASTGNASSISFSSTSLVTGNSAFGTTGGSGDISSGTITGWTVDADSIFGDRGTGGIAGRLGGGGAGGDAGGGSRASGAYVGRSPLDPTPFVPPGSTATQSIAEGSGGGGTGNGERHGGAAPGGGGAGASNIGVGAGTTGRTYVLFGADAGLMITQSGGTPTETGGIPVGAPTESFRNTNHVNQEIIRRINFREFGANSAFATANTTSQNFDGAFTLDDGTTTLVSNNVGVGTSAGAGTFSQETPWFGGSSAFLTLTFVGTGLDVVMAEDRNGDTSNSNALAASVDGFSIGVVPARTSSTAFIVQPVVSGLAYGTHTVRVSATGISSANVGVREFIIYGPKKPEIPEDDAGSLELSDYNVMADFTADTSNNINSMSKGSLGKAVARECILNNGVSGTGRWSTELSTDGNSYGSRLNETGDGSTREELFYTFYGDAFSMRMKSNTANSASNHEFYLDGTQITRTNTEGWDVDEVIFLNNTNNGTSDPSQTWPATGDVTRFDGSDTTKIIFPPSFNMGLGVHTIRIRHAGNSPGIFYGMEIGTPIHINEDSLKIGSTGLNNLTIDPVVEEDERQVQNLGEAKAWVNYNSTNNVILSSHNISAVIEEGTTNLNIVFFFDKPFKDNKYAIITSAGERSGVPNSVLVAQEDDKYPGSIRIRGNNGDTDNFYFAVYGELIDE